jgi:peptide/nickel transport system permease protein
MVAFVVRRLLQGIPVLIIASIAVFLILRLVPGDPATSLAGPDATPERVDEIRGQLGLNDSLPVQYVRWVGQLLRGDLGTSIRGLEVSRLLKDSMPSTIELAVAAYIFAILLGIPLGVLAGANPRTGWDWALSAFTLISIGIPSFLTGILLLWIFGVELGWLPTSGRVSFLSNPQQSLEHLILPAYALGGNLAAVLGRYTRTSVAEVMGQDYIRTARAKGLAGRQVIISHALRNSLVPVVTITALQIGAVLAGAVVVEQVFTRPGMGRLVVEAIQNRDYVVVQSTLVVLVTIFVLVNLSADLAYGFLDPRIRRR